MANQLYYDFGKPFSINDGQNSPDGVWKCKYKSWGTAAAQKMQSPTNGRSGSCMYINPKPNQSGTSAVLVLSNRTFKDFDMNFYMRTVSQNRNPPNNWEVAWIMWHYSGSHTHYYMYIGVNGTIEIGKKDYVLVDGGLKMPDGTVWKGNQEQQQFLDTGGKEPFVLDKWYKIRIVSKGNHITVYVNDQKKADIVDDGKIGYDSATKKRPLGYAASPTMLEGSIAFYSEDSGAEFDNITVADVS